MLQQVKFSFSGETTIQIERVINAYFGKFLKKEIIDNTHVYWVELDFIDLRILDNKFRLFAESDKYQGYTINT